MSVHTGAKFAKSSRPERRKEGRKERCSRGKWRSEIAKIGKAENKECRPLTSLLREPLLNL